jgi:sodium/potassium/calcium exchanger 6
MHLSPSTHPSTCLPACPACLPAHPLCSKLDPAVLGLTVLAWGNSLVDYMNNTAMAGRSRCGSSMAMTACFAGPLFNMLVGLGLGFWALLEEQGVAATAVEMDPVVLTGCVFLLALGAGLVAVSLAHRQWLPAWCGWAMVGWYGLYMLTALFVVILT